jgi:hypothetical protein
MRKFPDMIRNDPGRIMFSSLSREQAVEKLATFKRICKERVDFYKLEGFLYLSLTALYEQFCPPAERKTNYEVYEDGGSSWLHTIYEEQPVYFRLMMKYRDELMEIYKRGKTPVYFGCHETCRQHVGEWAMTRIFYSPNFEPAKWFHMTREAKITYRRTMREENQIHHVILDECELTDALAIYPEGMVQWAGGFVSWVTYGGRNPVPFHNLDIGERYRRFIEFRENNPIADMTWETFCDIYDVFHGYFLEEKLAKFLYSVSGAEVFLDDTKLYGTKIGTRYAIRERDWWTTIAESRS